MELANINSATGPPTRKLSAVMEPVGHLDEEPETSPESNLLIGAIVNTEFLAMLNRLEIPRLLENKWAKILHRVLTEYYQTYKKAPGATVTELIGCLKSDLDATDYGLILHTIKAAQKRFIEGGAEFDFRFNLDLTEKYLQSRAIVLHREEEKLLLKAGKFEEAGKLLEDFKLPTLADGAKSLSNRLPSYTLTFRQFEALDIPEPRKLVTGAIPISEAEIILITGEVGAGKTWLTWELFKIAATGKPGIDGLCSAPDISKVLILDGEMPLYLLKERSRFMGLADIPNLSMISTSLLERDDISPGIDLTKAETRDMLTAHFIDNKFQMVALDNIYSLCPGLDMSDAKEWSPINEWVKLLRSKEITTALIHHPNKAGLQFGTHARLFNADTALMLKKASPQDGDENVTCFTIQVDKKRRTGFDVTGKKFICKDGIWRIEGDEAGSDMELCQIALLLDKGTGEEAVAVKLGTGLTRAKVRTRRKKLLDMGILVLSGTKAKLSPYGETWTNDILAKQAALDAEIKEDG